MYYEILDKMQRNPDKDNAFKDFYNMIQKSWTYARLTDEEKTWLADTLDHTIVVDVLRGTYKQRFQILNAIYSAFLAGCGYNNDWKWRATKEELENNPKF